MAVKFNPFSGQLQIDEKGSGGASYIDGEVAVYADLPLSSTTAPLNTAWLVRGSSGVWPFTKPGGVYVRTATGGSSRDADYTYAGIFPDVFSDAQFTLYDDADTTKNAKFQLSGISTGTTRTITVPDGNGTMQLAFTTTNATVTGNVTISASRALIYNITTTTAVTADVTLPASGHQAGDIVIIRGLSITAGTTLTIRNGGGFPLNTLTATDQAYSYIATGTGSAAWDAILVDTHNHVDLSVTGRLNLPNANGTTAGDLYRNADTLRYRDSTNTERLLLNATDNLANLNSASAARTNLGVGSSDAVTFGSIQNTPIGSTTASSVAATTLSASGTVSGTGFSNYLASPPAIGGTSAAAGSFTTLSASTSLTLGTSGILSGGTNIIEQRNTTSAQTFRIYNTVSGAADANFERGYLRWSGNIFFIGSESAGTGTARQVTLIGSGVNIEGAGTNNITFLTNSTTRWIVGGSSGALQGSDTLPIRFGGSTSSFPRLANIVAVLRCQLADASAYAVFEALFRAQGTAPATSGAAGTAGDIRYDADYIYVCTAANTWKRAAIATW